MSIDRRATCTRCFVYGDVRSVESTLETFHTWRDPRDPVRRVTTVVLAGDPLHVLATAQGIRDLERLRGTAFGFDLAVTRAAAMTQPRACHESSDPPADDRSAPILLCDADASLERAARGRRALAALVEHALEWRNPVLAVLREHGRLAPMMRRALDANLSLDVVRFDGHNPFLLPSVEGFFADRDPSHILVGGHGPRVVSAAIGAGDFFLERAGDPSRLTLRARGDLVRRACVVTRFVEEPATAASLDFATELQRLDVRIVDATFASDPDGILVHPVAA